MFMGVIDSTEFGNGHQKVIRGLEFRRPHPQRSQIGDFVPYFSVRYPKLYYEPYPRPSSICSFHTETISESQVWPQLTHWKLGQYLHPWSWPLLNLFSFSFETSWKGPFPVQISIFFGMCVCVEQWLLRIISEIRPLSTRIRMEVQLLCDPI